MTTHALVDLAAGQGFEAVEPMPAHDLQTVEQARVLGDFVRERGLEVSCFSMCFEMFSRLPNETVATLKQRIDMAAAMGAPYFHHTIHPPLMLPRPGDISFSEAVTRAVDMLRELCAYATDRGVLCVYEDQGMYFNGCTAMRSLIERLGDTRFGLVADIGNSFFVDEQPEDFIGAFSDRIVHVHCKDYLFKPGTDLYPGSGWYVTRHGNYLRDTILGHGVVNLPAVFRVLERAHYDGWYSLEYAGMESPETGIPISLRNLRELHAAVLSRHVEDPGLP